MSNIYVEHQQDGTYTATQDKSVIARGQTQAETIAKAHNKRQHDPVLVERVRHTKRGFPDRWRRE